MGYWSSLGRLSRYLSQTEWRKHLAFIILLSALTVVLFIGYTSGPWPLGTDSQGLPMTESMEARNNGFFSSWEPFSALGFQNDPIPVPAALFEVASVLHISVFDVSKLIMVGSFWLSGALMYLCALRISRSYLGSAVAAVVFGMNQVFLSQIMEGHYFFAIGFALLPAVFLVVYLALAEDDRLAVLLIPVAFFIYGGSAAPHMVLILALFLVLFSAFYVALVRVPLRRLAYPAVAIFVLVLPSVLSRFSSGTGMYNAAYRLSEAQVWSNQDLFGALVTLSTENSHFTGGSIQTWVYPVILNDAVIALSVIVPVLAFLALCFKQNRRLKVCLVGAAIPFIFLAAGPNQPLGGLFDWMFRYVPLLDTIRVFSRFGMFIGLIYALLLALLIADLAKRPRLEITLPRSLRLSINRPDRLVAASLVVIMLAASSSVFVQGPGSYQLPTAYSAPFEWVAGQEGDFRVLTLPYGDVYYDPNLPKLDGYPATLTNDPGSYSQYYTGKEVAYGDHTQDFWSAWEAALADHQYGYRYLPLLLGDAASVRYVIAQVHAPADQVADFQGMPGLVPEAQFEGNASILANDHYQPRVHAASGLVLTTGARASILTSLATSAYDPASMDLALLEQVADPATRAALWDHASELIVQGGDLFELLAENGTWSSAQQVRLADLADQRSDDSDRYWVSTNEFVREGQVLYPSAYTTGANTLQTSMDVGQGGPHDLYLRMRTGPGSGNLTVTVNGQGTSLPKVPSLLPTEVWTKVGTYDLNASRVDIGLTNDGSGWSSVDDLLLVRSDEVQQRTQELTDHLAGTSLDIVYLYDPGTIMTELPPGWEVVQGEEGQALVFNATAQSVQTPLTRDLYLTADGNYTFTVRTMGNGTAPALSVDGRAVVGTQVSDGLYAFAADLDRGDHQLALQTPSFYSLAVEKNGTGGTPSQVNATVSYERPSNGQYVVHVVTDSPVFLKLTESYDQQWVADDGNGSVLHYPSSSQINGYYLPGAGNYTLTITYGWQERYVENLELLVGATFASTLALAGLLVWNGRRGQGKGRQ